MTLELRQSFDKKVIDFAAATRANGCAETIESFYFPDGKLPVAIDKKDMFDEALLDLDQSFLSMAPSGFMKKKGPTPTVDNGDVPGLERVAPLSNRKTKDFAYHASAEALSVYRVNSGCSEVGKKRWQNTCCPRKATQKADKERGHESPDCPTNEIPANFLTSARNLFKRDANGHLHRYHFVLSFYTGKYNQLTKETAHKISRQEACLRINPDKIASIQPKSIEMGIFFPTGKDFMSLALNRAHKICKLSQNKFIRQSPVYAQELLLIGSNKHRVNRQIPNTSQLYLLSRFVFVKLTSGEWPDITNQPPITRKMYDTKGPCWYHSSMDNEARCILPPISAIITRIALAGLQPLDFSGNGRREINNRLMLQKINTKILVDIINEDFVAVDTEIQARNFQRGEFVNRNTDLVNLNKPQVAHCRAPQSPNNLVEMEIGLKPSERVAREYRKTHSSTQDSYIRYLTHFI